MKQKRPKKKKSTSFVDDLKIEWQLFWEGFSGEDGQEIDPVLNSQLTDLSMIQLKALMKALSSDRKKLNQRLESLSKEIQENSERIDSLKLVGSDTLEVETKISELHDLGQSLSTQMQKIDDRLRWARLREDQMKNTLREL